MNADRVTNLSFGFTFLNLSIVGIVSIPFEDTFISMVRFGAVVCNLLMGLTLVFNTRSKSVASPMHRPFWLGMIICNIIIVKLVNDAVPLLIWPTIIYVVGVVISLVSLACLGLSFSVTPMLSTIKTGFIYKLVRHPMYLGESLMLIACGIASGNILVVPALMIYFFITLLRILEEEKVLLQKESYREYCKTTRWRLIPLIW